MPKVSIIMPARIRNADEAAWMTEAVDSVVRQTEQDWELVICDDRSEVWPDLPDDKRIKIRASIEPDAQVTGTSATRNLAATLAKSDLLLPLDSDDKLAPFALEKFLGVWKGSGFIYSSVMLFGLDWMRRYVAPEYSFPNLLKNPFCLVGSLHLKSDWAKVGGWKSELDGGLEDWEYWIALGELGVCGTPIQDVCYWYRRTANGRLNHLLTDRAAYQLAYHKMRELHIDSYDGRFPVGCCGGGRAAARGLETSRGAMSMANYTPPADIVLVQYTGKRQGSFGVRGNRSGIRYTVNGIGKLVTQPNGAPGVAAADVPFFKSLGRGADFAVYAPPKDELPTHEPVSVAPKAKEVVVEPEPESRPVEPSAVVVAPIDSGLSHLATIEPVDKPKRKRPRKTTSPTA